MPRRASAKRYAKAVFDLAIERDQLDRLAEDLRLMNETLQNQELRAFLEHAKVPLPRKVQAVGEVLAGVDPLMRNLLSLLVSRGLVDLVSEVEDGYQQLLNEFRGREQVEVRSAVPLEDPETERIAQFLTRLINKEIVLDSQVDPSILGGLVIKVGDRMIDGSARTRLGELGKQLQRYSAGIGV
jgi:F-type H+-transporting ATPase subunit delta